ncbi:hypothetical protein CEUSTIGMA_g6540.t1 [Chlamydomonas eustigma]|uniref:Paf1 complex subunit Cdc73 N-terminal domain-containing protein n=1 Tax=Chlamydomonas eustigma TaxID=1157962 RepID=A0A250X8K5_9CHLO|nr:hypothetical protein CEUSTIGMA_g6540.t1 [Chlamydomonas eustigma]|eukprot:GAX79100.1 hypothetical protein CEUSTIGMA_g6540.t1 [Chlamydomonas eustigma]
MDPLSLLKDFMLSGRLSKIAREGDRINFGGTYVFPQTASTGIKGAQKQDYTLEVILNLVQNRNLPHSEYLKNAMDKKISAVALTDRRKLLDFLDGKGTLQYEVPEGVYGAPSVGDDHHLEPGAKRARLEEEEGEIEGLESLIQQERQLRNRNTMLVAPHKDFSKVIEIVKKAMIAHQAKSITAPAGHPPQQHKSLSAMKVDPRNQQQHKPEVGRSTAAIPVKPSGRFDREVTTDQVRAMAGEAGANIANTISMYGAYNSSTGMQDKQKPPSTASHVPPHPDSRGGSTGSHRQPSSSSRKVLPGSGSGSRHVQAHSSTPQPSMSASHASAGNRASAPGKTLPAPPPGDKTRQQNPVPIIIVPSGLTAILNLYNAKQFFENGQYERSDVAQQKAGGSGKAPMVLVKRTVEKPAGKSAMYQIIDKAPEKGHDDWKRVVGVIVQGAKWQFKDWPHKGVAEGDLSEVFSQVCGFYLYFSDEKIPEAVTNWNVRKLALHKDNRHLDMTVLLGVYRHLDTFLSSRKSTLAY